MPNTSPPKPGVAFRVAVVGHRRDKLAPEADVTIMAAIADVLDALRTAVTSHLDSWPDIYRDDPAQLTVYTALAEGADRLAIAAIAGQPGWRYHVVLPFDQADYEQEFLPPKARESESLARFRLLLAGAESVTVMDGHVGRFDAYVPLERTLVQAADLLIAVWDGQDPAGPGGTAHLVRRARREDLPVVRIEPVAGGEVWLEDLSRPGQGRSDRLRSLESRAASLLSSPTNAEPARRWFAERGGPLKLPGWYDRAIAFMGGAGRTVRERIVPSLPEPIPEDPGTARRLLWLNTWIELPDDTAALAADRFADQTGWADELARWYAARFRSSFTKVYLFAAAAVLFAGLSDMEFPRGWDWVPAVMTLAEAGFLVGMLWVVFRGRRDELHARWIEYRSLAEQTRHLGTLWPLARSTRLVRVPEAPIHSDPRFGWVGWLLRATAREAGLVPGNLGSDYPLAARRFVRRIQAQEQQDFHRDRHRRLGHLNAPFERLAGALVMVALLFALLRLTPVPSLLQKLMVALAPDRMPMAEHWVWSLLAVFGMALPALAAGIHGFLATADLEGISLRSAEIEARLAQLTRHLDQLDPVELTAVGDLAVEMTMTMESELSAWRTAAVTRTLHSG